MRALLLLAGCIWFSSCKTTEGGLEGSVPIALQTIERRLELDGSLRRITRCGSTGTATCFGVDSMPTESRAKKAVTQLR